MYAWVGTIWRSTASKCSSGRVVIWSGMRWPSHGPRGWMAHMWIRHVSHVNESCVMWHQSFLLILVCVPWLCGVEWLSRGLRGRTFGVRDIGDVLQCVAVCCSVFQWLSRGPRGRMAHMTIWHDTYVTHCDTLRHTATHCNTLQHIATHCNTLQHAYMYIYEWVMSHVTSIIPTRSSVFAMTQWSVVAVAWSVWRVTWEIRDIGIVLQCVAICGSVLQRVAVCCIVAWLTHRHIFGCDCHVVREAGCRSYIVKRGTYISKRGPYTMKQGRSEAYVLSREAHTLWKGPVYYKRTFFRKRLVRASFTQENEVCCMHEWVLSYRLQMNVLPTKSGNFGKWMYWVFSNTLIHRCSRMAEHLHKCMQMSARRTKLHSTYNPTNTSISSFFSLPTPGGVIWVACEWSKPNIAMCPVM